MEWRRTPLRWRSCQRSTALRCESLTRVDPDVDIVTDESHDWPAQPGARRASVTLDAAAQRRADPRR
jgi:hypothetical protein